MRYHLLSSLPFFLTHWRLLSWLNKCYLSWGRYQGSPESGKDGRRVAGRIEVGWRESVRCPPTTASEGIPSVLAARESPGDTRSTRSPGRRWRGYLVTVIPLPSTTSPTTAAGVVCFSRARTSSSERVPGTDISNPPLVCGSKRGRRSSVATPSDHTVSFRYSRLPLRPPGQHPSAARESTRSQTG